MGSRGTYESPQWPVARTDQLQAFAEQGMSASQIARAFGDGCTRNMVIAKCHRWGIKLGGQMDGKGYGGGTRLNVRPGPHDAAPAPSRGPAVRKVAPTSFGPHTYEEVKARVEQGVRQRTAPTLVLTGEHNRPFKLLGAHMCKWPCSLSIREEATADSLFCGAPTTETDVYCATHRHKAGGGRKEPLAPEPQRRVA